MGGSSSPNPPFAAELDEKFAVLKANKDAWVTLPIAEKISILKEIKGLLLPNLKSWGRAGAAVRAIGNDAGAAASESLQVILVIARYIDSLVATLTMIQQKGAAANEPQVALRTAQNGQTVAKLFPHTEADKADKFLQGLTTELYIQPGKPATCCSLYLSPPKQGKVAALLGAGNYGALGMKDILYSLYECGHVVLFKPHPIQEAWHKWADIALEPLLRRGFYRSVHCSSVSDTQAMLYHPAVDHVHMTGGTATHDAIVWGADPQEQADRRARNDPVLKVPITSELGCVTPWLVTPAKWTDKQLQLQALDAVTGIMANVSCSCNAPKVLLLPSCWDQADTFLSKIKEAVRAHPVQPAYYPGIHDRYKAWRAHFPNAEEVIGTRVVPCTKDNCGPPLPLCIQELVYPEPGTELTQEQKYVFTVEPFAPVLAVVRIPCKDAQDYLVAAVQFANTRLWGSLSCTLLLHPDTEAAYPQAVQQALDDLKYGCICINTWSAIAYAAPGAVWGAYAGDQTTADVGSGIGLINNSLLFDHPQKAVVRVPIDWFLLPKPAGSVPAWIYNALAGWFANKWSGVFTALVRAK